MQKVEQFVRDKGSTMDYTVAVDVGGDTEGGPGSGCLGTLLQIRRAA